MEELHADILCIQEVKMTRKQLTQDLCVMDKFDAFYDLHPTKGYAGTATYIRKSMCVPVAAETGITGHASDASDAIGPPIGDLRASVDAALLEALDTEGRCVIVDCGLFVLINVYAPNETGPQRMPYKYVQRLTQNGLPRCPRRTRAPPTDAEP